MAALAVAAGGRQVRTFHICFDEAKFDESPHARAVADALGTEHVEFRLTQAHFRAELDGALASLDQPTFDGINTYFVSKLVREAGFTVALASTGGDELFGGYRSFVDLPRARWPLQPTRFIPDAALAGAAKLALRLKFGATGDMPPQTRWGKLSDVLTSHGDPLKLYQVSYGLFTGEFLKDLSDANTLSLAPYGLPSERSHELSDVIQGSTPLNAVSQFELALFLGERLMRDTDAASMASSLEVRVPLLDHVVVEAAQAVPDSARFHPLGKKNLLKALALPKLDAKLFDRPKAGFVLPIEVWAKDQVAAEVAEVFADRALAESVGFRPQALDRLLRAFRAGAPGIYWSRVWAPYVFLQWCRRHRVALG
jgi:asparagine synthase (glutamine-hydrolysing)